MSDCWSVTEGGSEREVQQHQSRCDRCAFWLGGGGGVTLNRS